MAPPLIETGWLEDHLGQSHILVLDGSWHLPTTGRNGAAEFEHGHIPGAQFFDIDKISDQQTTLPHMLPTVASFETAVRELGVCNNTHIIIYDVEGLFSAARVWWMFRVFGHKQVSILNGGFKKWLAENRAVEKGPGKDRGQGTFNATMDAKNIINYNEIKENIKAGLMQVIDARPKARFKGVAPEPRPELPSGHIPGSHSLPASLLTSETGCVKDTSAIETLFHEAGVDLQKPIVTTCGSGITAAILTFGLYLMGKEDVKLYDGSWSEYAAQKDAEIVSEQS